MDLGRIIYIVIEPRGGGYWDNFFRPVIFPVHYSDVIMSVMAFQITSVSIVCSIVCSDEGQRKYQSPHRWSLWGEFTGDRWIPRTKASNTEYITIWCRHYVSRMICRSTSYLLNITFIFHKCHRSSAAATVVKYECDLQYLTCTFVRSEILLTGKLRNVALVNPPQIRSVKHNLVEPSPAPINRNQIRKSGEAGHFLLATCRNRQFGYRIKSHKFWNWSIWIRSRYLWNIFCVFIMWSYFRFCN